jgi:hypothetical protein
VKESLVWEIRERLKALCEGERLSYFKTDEREKGIPALLTITESSETLFIEVLGVESKKDAS